MELYLICVVVGFVLGYGLGRSCPAVVVHGCAVNGSTNTDREFRKSGTNLENRAPHAHAKAPSPNPGTAHHMDHSCCAQSSSGTRL